MKQVLIVSVMMMFHYIQALPQSLETQGQLSGWATINGKKIDRSQIGARYILGLDAEKKLSKIYTLTAELSINAYDYGQFEGWDDIKNIGKIKPYRMWLRFASSRFEARAGLQKISFGSASLLRPLMWFDRIDPRDPLQITDGVYGLLLRYYFPNNVNIWFWDLIGNDKTKGWEFFATRKEEPEYGGRIQVPLFTGEMALTFHRRKIDLNTENASQLQICSDSAPENRIGLDGKWDIGVGLWFEGTMIKQNCDILPFPYQRFLNIGLDYTIGLGNGLHVLSEYFRFETSEKPFNIGERFIFSAVSLSYPLGLLDNIRGMVYYDSENHDWYRFIDWQRTYDRWSSHIMGFWNPEQFQIYRNITENNLFAGKGVQIMVVINH